MNGHDDNGVRVQSSDRPTFIVGRQMVGVVTEGVLDVGPGISIELDEWYH